MDGKQHFSASIVSVRHPAPAPRWVGASLPWSLHPLQNAHCEATLAANQARRHSVTDRRCTHCGQLNPSETLFPCWEEAPFLSNRSALSCCFLSGLSLGPSEISSDTCSSPWEQDAQSVMQTIWLHWHCAAQKLFTETEKVRQRYGGLQT